MGALRTPPVCLALDPGATDSTKDKAMLVSLGYDPSLFPNHFAVMTASGVVSVPQIPLLRITALGQDQFGFPVLCHTLPPNAGIDGLLGLDFVRGEGVNVGF
jgi:hypothetical protein